MNSELTRERIAQFANDPMMCVSDEVREIARIALQSFGNSEQLIKHQSSIQASDVMGSGYESKKPSSNDPVALIKPVADLYGITSPTGSETTFTFDAVEASSSAKSGWTVQEYVELERYQQYVTGNSPVTPDGWIPVSERTPEASGRYWCYVEGQNSLGKSHYQWNCSWNGEVWSDKALTGRVTHWMPLPSAPQQ